MQRGTSREEVKDAYLKLAKDWHPDAHASSGEAARLEAEQKFKRIQQVCPYVRT